MTHFNVKRHAEQEPEYFSPVANGRHAFSCMARILKKAAFGRMRCLFLGCSIPEINTCAAFWCRIMLANDISQKRKLSVALRSTNNIVTLACESSRIHSLNCDPKLFTEKLTQAVPLLRFIRAEIKVISHERTVTSAPLLESTTNQNGTHQASVFYILADYTLGIALFAAIPWVYVIDVHDKCDCQPVQMWLLSGQVRHIAPGTGEITAVASISPDRADKARLEFTRKRRCRLKGTVKFYQENRLIALAEHEVGMYAVPGSQDDLRPI